MELKCWTVWQRSFGSFVLIVPLWNWNSCGEGHMSRVLGSNRTFMELKWLQGIGRAQRLAVLIVPLWNWNCYGGQDTAVHRCSNRTFMELKLISSLLIFLVCLVLIVPLWNWNGAGGVGVIIQAVVLIVPLWNWNETRVLIIDLDARSNRTFMELK